MNILLIDKPNPSMESLKTPIEQATGVRVTQVSTIADGLKTLLVPQEKVGIVVFTISNNPNQAVPFIRMANRLGATGRIGRPLFLALSLTKQSPALAARLDKFGVQLFLRKYPEQVVEAIKKLQWQARITNRLPTVIIERRGGQTIGARVQYQGATKRLLVGPRLGPLATYFVVHRKREHSTQVLADVLGISRQSVKEYLLRLRSVFDQIRAKLGTTLRGKDVFWTKRTLGGHVHGLSVNAEIEDSEEFFLPEDDANNAAATLRCRVCRRKNPRAQTAWSNCGWTCADCCEELRKIGEI